MKHEVGNEATRPPVVVLGRKRPYAIRGTVINMPPATAPDSDSPVRRNRLPRFISRADEGRAILTRGYS